ncbi:U3 small nucleolar RNA-associated protein 25 homolog [Mercenaria mercenaria]|uniref:U3 small nucleolar RNA-associated protein 25 homolog n=1 Tax=Mercenaria mercenaria TaxID=6596 RepID=UPI00234EAD25|nr:U3 small nucleolar RNA-associated protein 25 homolog [Mercenaria mercenaria]
MNENLRSESSSFKMGRHEKRKRRTIDLNFLSKKHRKIYRDDGRKKSLGNREQESVIQEDKIQEKERTESSSSSDDEVNPYQQLIATLDTAQSHQDSEEESDSDNDAKSGDDSDKEINDDKEEESNSNSDVEGDNVDTSKHNAGDEDDAVDDEEDNDSNDDSDNDELDSDESDDITEVVADFDDDELDNTLQESDPFIVHFERDLEEKVVEELAGCKSCHKEVIKVPGVGQAFYKWSIDQLKQKISHRKEKDLANLHVKESLVTNLPAANRKMCNVKSDQLTAFQGSLFSIINNYQDVFYSERSHDNGEEIRLVYCLHALNHVLKTRKRVISHNTKIKQKGENLDNDEDYRDQGLTRPKVLMILPFRESAKRVVDMFIQLLNPTDQGFVANKKRFYKEYGLSEEEEPKKGYKPEDFEATFAGSIDDHFRIGIGVAKKTLKLYTKFYSADIILASPLGLRTLIGSEGDKERDYDFLNSIEVLIIDQADILMMQNWDHVLHIMQHLHLQPQESHGVDFSRVRMWTLNGWGKYYRQSLIFRSVPVPEISALFNKHCHNFAGKNEFIRPPSTGTICQITAQLPQVFHRLDSTVYSKIPDDRFDFFIKKVLPHHSDAGMSQTLIFVPSYFDFVRLRNYFRREEINFVQICEYSKDKTVNTARNLFYHKKVPYLLYTERFHFYKRVRLRGIRHIVFYGLPQYPNLYSEMCNMLHDAKSKHRVDNQTCTVIYAKFDAQKLAEVVGTERAGKMIHSQKSVHMFVTGENG